MYLSNNLTCYFEQTSFQGNALEMNIMKGNNLFIHILIFCQDVLSTLVAITNYRSNELPK